MVYLYKNTNYSIRVSISVVVDVGFGCSAQVSLARFDVSNLSRDQATLVSHVFQLHNDMCSSFSAMRSASSL